MKKILLSFAIIFLFTFSVLPIKTAFAEESTPSAEPASVKIIKYDLAYPGMLPDNPLYKLKVLRDKIISSMISDPNKKIDFYLTQVDKGILASAMLIDKNNVELAETTALKAEHNFTLLTYELGKLEQKPNNEFFNKLKTASLKHQEILNLIISRVPREKQKTFENVITFSQMNLKSVEKYQKKKRFY